MDDHQRLQFADRGNERIRGGIDAVIENTRRELCRSRAEVKAEIGQRLRLFGFAARKRASIPENEARVEEAVEALTLEAVGRFRCLTYKLATVPPLLRKSEVYVSEALTHSGYLHKGPVAPPTPAGCSPAARVRTPRRGGKL